VEPEVDSDPKMRDLFKPDTVIATAQCKQGHEVPVTLDSAESSAFITCPTCGQRIHVHGENFRVAVRNVDRAIDDLRQSIKEFGR
jgi:transcription elongation factor Elf1